MGLFHHPALYRVGTIPQLCALCRLLCPCPCQQHHRQSHGPSRRNQNRRNRMNLNRHRSYRSSHQHQRSRQNSRSASMTSLELHGAPDGADARFPLLSLGPRDYTSRGPCEHTPTLANSNAFSARDSVTCYLPTSHKPYTSDSAGLPVRRPPLRGPRAPSPHGPTVASSICIVVLTSTTLVATSTTNEEAQAPLRTRQVQPGPPSRRLHQQVLVGFITRCWS